MSQHPAGGQQLKITKVLAIATLAATIGVILYSAISLALMRSHAPLAFDGDEARHAMWGATIYLDLVHGDIGSFLRHSYAQNRFPFIYSYLQMPLLAIFGITSLAHRLVGIVFMVALSATVYLCVVWGRPGPNAWIGGSVAALLVAGCPALYPIASRVYIEPAGLFLMMLTYALYLRAQSTHSTRWAWAAGLLHLICWFTKWQFGILVSLVLVAHILIRSYPHWREAARNPVVVRVVLPAWVAVGLWLANPYQLREFAMYLTSMPHRYGWQKIVADGLVMQLRFILTCYSGTSAAGVVVLGALAYGLCRFRWPTCSLYALAALGALGTNIYLRGGSEQRIFLWLLPPLWVLTGLATNEGAKWLTSHMESWKPPRSQAVVAIVVVLLLGGAIGNATLAHQRAAANVARGCSPHLWEALDYMVKTVPPDRRIATAGCWIRGLSPRLIIWGYLAEFGRRGIGYDDLQLWSYPPPDPNARDVLHFRWPWRVRIPAEGPPRPPPNPVVILRRADIDVIIACCDCTEALPSEHQGMLAAATGELGFTKARQHDVAGCNRRIIIYSRPSE